MCTRLETLHVEQDQEDIRTGMSECNSELGYHIVDSKEKGRIMFCHSNIGGCFKLSIDRIRDIYYTHDCNCLVCCYPSQQWAKNPELAAELNLQYPEVEIEIYSDITINHILSIGKCTDWMDMAEKEDNM